MIIEAIKKLFRPDKAKLILMFGWMFLPILFAFLIASFELDDGYLLMPVVFVIYLPILLIFSIFLKLGMGGIGIALALPFFYIFSCVIVEFYRMKNKKENVKKLFQFNKVRALLFVAIFLLFPIVLTYPSPRLCEIGCGFEPRLCLATVDTVITPLIHGAFLVTQDYLKCYSGSLLKFLNWEIPKNLVIALFASYALQFKLKKSAQMYKIQMDKKT